MSPRTPIAILLVVLLANGCATGGASRQLVLSPEELQRVDRAAASDGATAARRSADAASASDVRVLDVRPREQFEAGHWRGAIWIDPADWKDRSLTPAGDLSHAAAWRDQAASLGLRPDDRVIVYDDGGMTEAARVWFILQEIGYGRAAVLDGGFRALSAAAARNSFVSGPPSRTISAGDSASSPADDSAGKRGPAATPPVGLSDRQGVMKAIRDGSAVVLDVRSPAEYTGQDARGNPRPGRVPGAFNLPHTQLLDARGRLKSPEELQRLFADSGALSGRPIIVHCQSGGRSSLAALAAASIGLDVSNYYASFGDWSADASCPVERMPGAASTRPAR